DRAASAGVGGRGSTEGLFGWHWRQVGLYAPGQRQPLARFQGVGWRESVFARQAALIDAIDSRDREKGITSLHHVLLTHWNLQPLTGRQPIGRLQPVGLDQRAYGHAEPRADAVYGVARKSAVEAWPSPPGRGCRRYERRRSRLGGFSIRPAGEVTSREQQEKRGTKRASKRPAMVAHAPAPRRRAAFATLASPGNAPAMSGTNRTSQSRRGSKPASVRVR